MESPVGRCGEIAACAHASTGNPARERLEAVGVLESDAGHPFAAFRSASQVVRKILPPAGAGWLRDRVEPAVPLHLDTRVVRTSDAGGRLRLTLETRGDEQEVVVDRVVAGTGYRVAIDRLEFLAPELRDDIEIVNGAPRLSAHFESRTVPGLYFVGLAAAQTFGPAMRFVCGTAFAGRTVARHVRSSDRSRRRTRQPVAVAS